MNNTHTSTTFRPTLRLFAALVLVATSVACGSVIDNGDANDGGTDGEKSTLSMTTYSSYVADPDVLKSVGDKINADVEIDTRGDGVEVVNAAVLSKGSPSHDIIFGVDETTARRLIDSDALAPLQSVDMVDSEISKQFLTNSSGENVLAAIDYGDVCFNYEKAYFESSPLSPPESFDDLVDPAYKKLTVVASPLTSSVGITFLAGLYSVDGLNAEQFIADMVANEMKVVGSWDDAWNGDYSVNGGSYPIVLSYASSPVAEVFYGDELTEPLSGVATKTCTRQIEYAGVLDGTGNSETAEAFINAMRAPDWQASIPLTNFVYPINTNVVLDPMVTSNAATAELPVALDADTVDKSLSDWIDSWRDNVS